MNRRIGFAEGLLVAASLLALAGLALRAIGDEGPWGLCAADGVIAIGFLGVGGAALTLQRRARRCGEIERAYRQLLEQACDAVLVVGPDRCIRDVRPRSAALFGYAPAEIMGLPVRRILPDWSPLPADWPTAVQDRTAAPGQLSVAEFAGRVKDGTALPLEIAAAPAPGLPPGSLALLVRDVTRARRVRDELRATEAHLRLVVEQMPAILWTTDAQLQITSTVGAGLAALDIQPTEVIGMSMLETLGRDDPECTPVSAHLRALRGESLSHEMEWKGRTFQVRVEPLRSPNRKISGTIGVVLDVTDHRQTVAELRARVRQQAAVAELGRQALAGGKLDDLLADATRAVRETLDVELCEFVEAANEGAMLRRRAGAGWGGADLDAVAAGVSSPAGHAMATGTPVSVPDLSLDPRFADDVLAREHGVVSSKSVPVQGGGRSYGVLCAHATRRRPFTDHDRNFLQAVAHVLAAALDRTEAEATQNRLVALLEATTDGVAIAAADHRLLYVNRAGRTMLGLGERSALTGLSLADLYPPELRERFRTEVVPVALNKGAWSGEIDLQGRTGQRWTVSQVVLAHRDAGGTVEFLSMVSRDLGERLRLEAQLRQAQKMEAVGRLAGGIAHDFNNLLCIITGYSEMALTQLAADATLHSFLSEINKAGNRAATLTRQLLAFSRKQLLAPKVLDLNGVIRDAGTMLRRMIGEDVELATTLAAELPPVKADPNQLEQVLMNLAVNARDAMPQGGRLELRTATVRLTDADTHDQPEVRPGAYVVLEVRDSGLGMSEEVKARIFEPFFTTKGVGKGTGLGLAMVYGIVKQSGGHIDVESAPGRGTTFRILLPSAGGPADESAAPIIPADVPAGTETVLLVEDEDGVRALVREVLARSGYTVLEARDGDEALALNERHAGPIHLLLTDVVMPRLGGSRLARRISRVRPDTRVLFMSGFADSTLVRHEVISGEVACLVKPFTPELLARKVREILDTPPLAG